MGVWDGVERCERRCMESETHQVREEANRKRLVSRFPHFPSWPPPDDNVALGPTWCLRTPPTLTNACHFEHEPVISHAGLSFRMWACHFAHEPVISNMSPSSHMRAHRFECEPSFRMQARCFEHEPVVLHASLSFQMWARHFAREPVVSNMSPSSHMRACHFECEPLISHASPSFRTWARHFACGPVVSNVSLLFRMQPMDDSHLTHHDHECNQTMEHRPHQQ